MKPCTHLLTENISNVNVRGAWSGEGDDFSYKGRTSLAHENMAWRTKEFKLTDIFANQGLQTLVDSISLCSVTSETNSWEFGVDHARVDLSDTKRSVNQFKQQGSWDGINSVLGSCRRYMAYLANKGVNGTYAKEKYTITYHNRYRLLHRPAFLNTASSPVSALLRLIWWPQIHPKVLTRNGADVDDMALLLFLHTGKNCLGKVNETLDIGVQHSVNGVFSHIG